VYFFNLEENPMATASFNQTTIHDASTKELLAFARQEAGLTFKKDAGRAFIIQEIYTNLGWDAYKPEEGATHVVIKLPKTKELKHPYQGGFNGKMFTIKRNVETEIPIGFYNTMIEAATCSFALESLGASEDVREGSPASRRLSIGDLDISVIRFINKGSTVAPAPKEAPVDTYPKDQ
jgi:hypothetical protein